MKAKTKDQLRDEIFALKIKLDSVTTLLGDVEKEMIDIFQAFAISVASEQLRMKQDKDNACLEWIVIAFFAKVKMITGLDVRGDNDSRVFEWFCSIMDFDEVTTIVIEQRITQEIELLKMLKDGKSNKEIQEFIRKCKETRNGGNMK